MAANPCKNFLCGKPSNPDIRCTCGDAYCSEDCKRSAYKSHRVSCPDYLTWKAGGSAAGEAPPPLAAPKAMQGEVPAWPSSFPAFTPAQGPAQAPAQPASAAAPTTSAPTQGNEANKLGKEAFAEFNKGRFAEAIKLYSAALDCATVEEKPLIFCNRSAARLRVQQFADAMADAKEAILLKPTWSKGHLRRGEAAGKMAMWMEACAAFREALRLDPGNETIAHSLAEAEEEAEELGEDVDAVHGPAPITPTILPFARPAGQDAVDQTRRNRVSPIQAFIKSRDPALCRELDEALQAYFSGSRDKAPLVVSGLRRLEILTSDSVRQNPNQMSALQLHAILVSMYRTVKDIAGGGAGKPQSARYPSDDSALSRIRDKTAELEALAGTVQSEERMPTSVYPRALKLFEEAQTLCLVAAQSYVCGAPKVARQVAARGLIACCKLAFTLMSVKDTPKHCLAVELLASYVGALMLPAPSADAACLSGIVKVLNNIAPSAEGISKLAAALKMKPSQWSDQSSFRNLRQIAESVLGAYRGPLVPLEGNWLSQPLSGLAGRYGPGTTQIGPKLFVFGGIRIPARHVVDPDPYYAVFHEYNLMHNTDAHESIPLNDLVCFDFETNCWEQVRVDGASPPPRGMCLLEHDPADPDSLYLVGGRDSFFVTSNNGQHKNDPHLWHFSLKTHKWTEYKLQRFRLEAEILGSVIFHNKWYIVEQCNHCCHVLCFDLAKKTSPMPTWVEVRGASNGPPLQHDCLACHFFSKKTSTLYIWARPLNEAVANTRFSEVGGELWGVEFSTSPATGGNKTGSGKGCKGKGGGGGGSSVHVGIRWRKFEVGVNTPWTGAAIPSTFMGPKPLTYGETACAFDEATQRCYIFGGYNENHMFPGVDRTTGGSTMNNGKFNDTVFELDVAKLTCRALESAGGRFPLGPEARALVHNRRLLCAGGYKTLDPVTGRYGQWRGLEDEWICALLPDALNSAASAAQGAQGGAGGTNRRFIELHQVDHSPFTTNAVRAVMQDPARRAALAAASPTTTRGVVIVNVFDTPFPGKPLSLDAVFSPSNMHWIPLPELFVRFPILRREVARPDDIVTLDRIEREPPADRIQALFIVDYKLAGGRSCEEMSVAAGHLPVHAWGFFSRPTDDRTFYYSEADAALGKLVASSAAGDRAFDPTTKSAKKAGTKSTIIEIEMCSNPACPRADLYVEKAVSKKGVQEEVLDPSLPAPCKVAPTKAPKLMRCGLCFIAQYCGAECQKAAWPAHKAACRAAAGK